MHEEVGRGLAAISQLVPLPATYCCFPCVINPAAPPGAKAARAPPRAQTPRTAVAAALAPSLLARLGESLQATVQSAQSGRECEGATAPTASAPAAAPGDVAAALVALAKLGAGPLLLTPGFTTSALAALLAAPPAGQAPGAAQEQQQQGGTAPPTGTISTSSSTVQSAGWCADVNNVLLPLLRPSTTSSGSSSSTSDSSRGSGGAPAAGRQQHPQPPALTLRDLASAAWALAQLSQKPTLPTLHGLAERALQVLAAPGALLVSGGVGIA